MFTGYVKLMKSDEMSTYLNCHQLYNFQMQHWFLTTEYYLASITIHKCEFLLILVEYLRIYMHAKLPGSNVTVK